MTTFNDREKAAENKYAHDKEIEFRIHARRNKLMGQWAASRMNISGAPAEEYVKGVIAATVSAYDDEVIIGRIRSDLSARGVAVTENQVRAELLRVTEVAKEQIHAE